MITLSVALHVGIATGIALTYLRGTATLTSTSSAAATPAVILLRSQEMAGPGKVAMAEAQAPASSRLKSALPLLPPALSQATTIAAPARTVALEANPNAHLRALPPDAVLCPTPAPILDSSAGVVFILDISGSMYEPYAGSTRLALAREELSRRIRALKDGTPFALVLYAQNARKSGPLVAANDATRDAAVRFVLRDLDCGGGTNLPAGLALAQQLHAGNLIVATDGDLNVSASNLMPRVQDILGSGASCPSLLVIGVGPRPNTGAEQLLQGLTDQQGGTYLAEQFAGNTLLLTSVSSPSKPIAATP
jgi:Mg-chelatase subunit ChlD